MSSVRISSPGLEAIYVKGSSKSDSLASGHWDSRVDGNELRRENRWEDDMGEINERVASALSYICSTPVTCRKTALQLSVPVII